jgi:hypothetical protein
MVGGLPDAATKELNSLNTLVKTSVLKTMEAVIDHLIDLLDQDIIHLLQQAVTRGVPLFGGYLDESLRDDIRVVIWKFPRPSPVKE